MEGSPVRNVGYSSCIYVLHGVDWEGALGKHVNDAASGPFRVQALDACMLSTWLCSVGWL